MDILNADNLQQALNKNNVKLISEINTFTSNIEVSSKNGNALKMNADGLFINDIKNKILSIKEALDNGIFGIYVVGEVSNGQHGDYATKYDETLTIQTNLTFIPKKVFVCFSLITGGTASTYQASGEYLWVSNSEKLDIEYDTNYSASTTTGLGVCASIETFDEDKIVVRLQSAQTTKNTTKYGSSAASKVAYRVIKWVAIM